MAASSVIDTLADVVAGMRLVDTETMLARARARDVAWVGSEEVVVERYRQRVIPSHLLYEALVRPVDRADAVVDTRDLNARCLVRLGAMTRV